MINSPKTTYVKDNAQVVPSHTFDKADVLRKSFAYFNGNENRFGFAWRRYSMSAQGITEVGGVSANRFRLINPVTSNVIAVIEKMVVASSVADQILIAQGGFNPGQLPTVLTPQRLDGRIGTSPSGILASTDTAGGPDSPQIGVLAVPANTSIEAINHVDQELVLVPNDYIGISQATVTAGTILRVWCVWRERLLEESEKSGNYGRLL